MLTIICKITVHTQLFYAYKKCNTLVLCMLPGFYFTHGPTRISMRAVCFQEKDRSAFKRRIDTVCVDDIALKFVATLVIYISPHGYLVSPMGIGQCQYSKL